MGTLAYVALRFLGFINTAHDLTNICFLIAIDSIGVPALFRMIRGDG